MTPENPQLEKGFVGLANALYERLYQSALPAKEVQAVMFVIRVTYGYRAKTGPVYSAELAEDIEVDTRYAKRILANLVQRKVILKITEAKGRTPATYTLNKNWQQWKHCRKSPFPPLKEHRRGVAHYPSTEKIRHLITPQSEADYPSNGNGITPLLGSPLPLIAAEPTEQINTVEPPKTKTENTKHNPPTPKGAGGGVETEDCLREKLRSRIASWGWQAGKKDLDRAEDLVRGPTPAGWEKVTWRRHTLRRLYEQLQDVESEMNAGAKIYSPVTVGAHRAQARLALDAKTPHNFEQRKEAI